ncbi:hypothetical protein NDU88_008114 [Pleurodeles waltl]|uniref:Uncharacterized protein n=1 Tax=Pleurodeles waltl TaxID=8319 RepID=A0AAV7NV10_PLEWA|nr:hypothetical protein NDU88_008114 [Pleurodeles waltl]
MRQTSHRNDRDNEWERFAARQVRCQQAALHSLYSAVASLASGCPWLCGRAGASVSGARPRWAGGCRR